VPGLDPWDELDPISLEQELWEVTGRPDDPAGWELRATDLDPDHPDAHDVPDPARRRLTAGNTRWTLDLDDPYDWSDIPAETTSPAARSERHGQADEDHAPEAHKARRQPAAAPGRARQRHGRGGSTKPRAKHESREREDLAR
jgi:hypothetical protein